jgi:Ulp1 family protease
MLICEFNLRIVYYDSIDGVDAAIYLDATMQLLEEAAMDKKLVSLEELSNGLNWTTITYANTPRQENVTDCGVHVCINMHCLAFDLPLTCSPTNANFFRKKIGCDIVRGAIMMW